MILDKKINKNSNLKFIDLFAGIGGFHLALTKSGMKCVFASEFDEAARKTYLNNFKIDEKYFNSDIRDLCIEDIPEHDILCAGFPCQPFSQAGYKKGFNDGDDSERGNLFFCILDILEYHKPKAFILENVRHLLKHDEGKTFHVICSSLEELGYSVTYKVIKASDFGRPQHRPRIYIVGFYKESVNTEEEFKFPSPIPLKMTMSDVWGGNCDRDIGFTIRVGGKSSPIDDRRNWDGYRVDGKVVRLGPEQALKMLGFPDNFKFPVSRSQAMKQLGNSVCVDVVEHIANTLKNYLAKNVKIMKQNKKLKLNLNKGEWSEIFVFFKIIVDRYLKLGDIQGNPLNESVMVFSIKHNDSEHYFNILENGFVDIMKPNGLSLQRLAIKDIISSEDLNDTLQYIKSAVGTFELPKIVNLMENLKIEKFKGSSYRKEDLTISFKTDQDIFENQGVGIKSFIGAMPTLLNASSATNFIFEISDFKGKIDSVNAINSKNKIKDRISYILEHSKGLKFLKCEKSVHENNLKKIDSCMPEILSDLLLKFYKGDGSLVQELIKDENKVCRIKDYLKYVLLGMFPSQKWDGNNSSNGTIVLRKDGDLLLYHIIYERVLKDYLFHSTRLDTPSSSRHRFGSVYQEKGSFYIKLNLQIRHCSSLQSLAK